MIRYLVAKYVDDLSRNEPVNIGVIVYDGSRAVARFDGENEIAEVDLRRVRHRITGSHAYRAWVEYWRAVLANPEQADSSLKDLQPGDSRVVEKLIASSGRDFYLEHGGAVLLDAEDETLEETLDDLFHRMIRHPDPPSPPTLQEKSKEALSRAGAPLADETRFREQEPVKLDIRGAIVPDEISYAVKNGTWHFLQEVPFSPDKPRVSRKEATHCAFLYEHSPEFQESGAFLYDSTDLTGGQYQFLEMLMKLTEVVNVNDTDTAAERLQKHLHLN